MARLISSVVLLAVLCTWSSAIPRSDLPEPYHPAGEDELFDKKPPLYEENSQFNTNARCSVFVNSHLGDPQPLIIRPNTLQFNEPTTAAGIVRVEFNQQAELFCTSGFRNPAGAQTMMATCINETRFLINGQEHLFQNINCNALPQHTARRTGRRCFGNAVEAEIGFVVGARFFRILEVCHDEASASNLWVYYRQHSGNQGFQRSFPRISFIQGDFYAGMNPQNLYTRFVQHQTFTRILGSANHARQFVHEDGDIFLARGHLAARADYIFGPHQQASFYFINAAPQWQSFNGGNWEHIEDGVRRMIADRGLDCQIWTGTWGITTLPDTAGVRRQLFLDVDANGNGRLPVPMIFYKIIIDTISRRGIAFIGVNNPHLSMADINRDYIFCNDVGAGVNYVPWNRFNLTGGYSYACNVGEFAQRITNLPPLPQVTGLLL